MVNLLRLMHGSTWIHVVQVNPHLFAQLSALGETAVAIGLIFGIFSNITMISGFFLSLMIWSTAEGFGGPYMPGSTDIVQPLSMLLPL